MSDELQTHEVIQPEDREVFDGQHILVIGGPDAHALSMAVLSAQYLESRGATTEIYIGSPVIREGKGATHSGAFFSKTLPNMDTTGIDRVVIVDIPLDFKNLEASEQALVALDARLHADRERRGLAPITKTVLFADHHSTTSFVNAQDHGVLIKQTATAEACRFGSTPSLIARIGAIADRDAAELPITEEEMLLAKGFDAAVRPAVDDPKPTTPEQLSAWEGRVQGRIEEAVRRLKAGDLEYFRQEALKLEKPQVPVATGFGNVVLVDTQGLTNTYTVYKLIEAAIENVGADRYPYAIAVLRGLPDEKMGREPADVITIVRHWTREDLPSVDDILKERFGEDFVKQHAVYGAPNAKSMRLPVDEHGTAQLAVELVQAFAGVELPDFSQVRSVVMCGDPNSGKSVLSTIFRESLKNLGVNVVHLDLDKAAPTPQWYLDAEAAYKEAEMALVAGKGTQEQFDSAKAQLEEAVTRRKAMKRPWSIELAQEAKDELMAASADSTVDFVIGDIGGGRITKDENGKIIKVQRLTAENARILEGADAVLIISNNPVGAAEWKKLIEQGVDPETGVRINREKPIVVLGVYQSVLEGSVQKVAGNHNEAGVVTNLDRAKAQRIYNPTVFATAMMVSHGVEHRRTREQAVRVRNPHAERLTRVAFEVSKRLMKMLPEGSFVDLGGSLRSDTALAGHNDIDLKVLLPNEWATEEKIRAVSAAIADMIPFQKVRRVDTPPNDQFAVMHQEELEVDGIDGQVEIEVSLRPAEGYVGYGKLHASLPEMLRDQYMVFKDVTRDDRLQYKKVKEQFYAMSRWLHNQGYWDVDGAVVGSKYVLEEAIKQFWGRNIEEVLNRPTPAI